MVVMGVVQDELVADFHERASERLTQVLFGEDRFGRANGNRCAIEKEHLVAAPGIVKAVGGDHDGASVVDLLLDHLVDDLLGGNVETGDGFVEEECGGVLCESLGHEHPLALTAGQAV